MIFLKTYEGAFSQNPDAEAHGNFTVLFLGEFFLFTNEIIYLRWINVLCRLILVSHGQDKCAHREPARQVDPMVPESTEHGLQRTRQQAVGHVLLVLDRRHA